MKSLFEQMCGTYICLKGLAFSDEIDQIGVNNAVSFLKN